MAYGDKYHIGWKSAARQRLEYDIFIRERDYEGEAQEAHLTGEGVVITYGAMDDDELTPIKPSSARITLMCESDDCDFSELYTEDATKYQIFISECRDNMCVVRWVGYVSTGLYSRPLKSAPFTVEIEANDGFEVLMSTPYQKSLYERYSDSLSLRDLISRLIAPISSRRVDVWGVPKVSPGQVDESCDVIGISDDSIYNAFESKVPSHYEALESVLRNFGLQAYFDGGRLVVRSVTALGAMTRPEWIDSTDIALGGSPTTALPLYSADKSSGEGISVDATLSMLPPLASMNVSRSDRDSNIIYSMLSPERWQSHVYTTGSRYQYAFPKKGRGTQGIRLGIDSDRLLNTNTYAVWSYVFDGQIASTESSVMTLEADFYSLLETSQNVRMLLYAVPLSINPIGWMDNWQATGAATAYEMAWLMPSGIYCYSSGRNTWVEIAQGIRSIPEMIRDNAFSVSPTPATKPMPFNNRQALDEDLKVSLSERILKCPPGQGYKMVLVMVGDPMNFAVEMVEPRLSLVSDLSLQRTEVQDVYPLGRYGSESVTLDYLYRERGVQSPISNLIEPSVIGVDTGESVVGYVAPSEGVTMPSLLASRLRALRGKVTRELEGEIYVPHATTLSSLWRDDTGRIYYTNYLRLLLRRGLISAQLRELRDMMPPRYTDIGSFLLGTSSAGDSVALITNASERYTVYRFEPGDNPIQLFEDFESAGGVPSISKGIGVMQLTISYSNRRECRAYDEALNLVATIDDLYSAGVPTVTPCYDINTSTWMCIYVDSGTSKVTATILDKSGAMIFTQAYDYTSFGNVIWMNSGFVAQMTNASGVTHTVWHSHEYHSDLDIEVVDTGGEKVRAINDMYVVTYKDGEAISRIYARQPGALGWDRANPLFISEPGYSFNAMNCALVVMRNSLAQAVIFDGRTLLDMPYHGEDEGSWVKHILLGDTIYGWYNGYIDAQKVIEGDGYADLADSLGDDLYDSNGQILRAKKYNGYEL